MQSSNGAAGPALSIVIASVNGHGYISQCLTSLAKQRGKERAEQRRSFSSL